MNPTHSTATRTFLPKTVSKPNRCWLALLPLLPALFSGCASVGKDFHHERVTSLEVGKTRSSEYRTMFGEKPNGTETRTTGDGKFEIIKYVYAFADMGSAKARVLFLEFRDEVLNGFNYVSSFDEKRPKIPMERAAEITKGVSTRSDVLNLLGKPMGHAMCPTFIGDFKDHCEKGVEIWSWSVMAELSTFGHAYGGQQVKMNTLSVIFDKNGVVSEVRTAAQGG